METFFPQFVDYALDLIRLVYPTNMVMKICFLYFKAYNFNSRFGV